MKRQYAKAPPEIAEAIAEAEIIEDFLPPPDQLVLREDTVKVTLNLSKESVVFLKREAQARGVPYQQMIRRIIDLYTRHYTATTKQIRSGSLR
jgi:predicted DNA binding CopG/RHH family protein